MARPFKCPKCGSTRRKIKKGYRYSKSKGIRPIRKCKDCGYRFTADKVLTSPPDEESE